MMKSNKQKNLIMLVIAAVILVGVNVGVFMAAHKGAVAPIDNMALWGAFVALNVASILWAVSLLGLQPFVVSLSYMAGGFLAYQGVRGMSGISVAEVTTAGATYGAFGALAIGNVTAKVRLAFFKKGQVPFIFIIVGLLVIDAGLNSGISSANGSVLLNAVAIPFAVAGVVVGSIWTVLNRFGIGRKPSEVLAAAAEEKRAAEVESSDSATPDKRVIPMPAHAMMEQEAEVPAEPVKVAEPVAPAAVQPQPVVAEKPEPVVKEQKEDTFFPLEIDKGETVETPAQSNELQEAASMMKDPAEDVAEQSFELPSFNSSLYESGSLDAAEEGGVLVKEPAVALDLDVIQESDVVKEEAPIAAVQPEPAKKEAEKEKNDDWLGGHLDLLNKLK